MLLLLAIASLLVTNHSAATPLVPRASPSDSVICDNINHCRRLYDIVWGCLATIFACIWVSVHPNVPQPTPPRPDRKGSFWQWAKWMVIDANGALILRLKLMVVALLGPEFIVGFAGRQLATARDFSKMYKISLTHGFFICMGGFVDSQGHPIVTCAQISKPGVLQAILKTPKSAIQDKSKGDVLSKGVALFQGLWFVLQCIARTSQRLPLTELEIATLAFAVVNIFTWLLWWGKPLDIHDPIILEVVSGRSLSASSQAKRPFLTKLGGLIGMAYDKQDYNPLANRHVPTFWYSSEDDDRGIGIAYVGQLLIAAIFGAIHCVAWNDTFPSSAELSAWRLSAALLAGVPNVLLVLAVQFTALAGLDHFDESQFTVFFLPFVILYVPPRLVLLVLPFTGLRALPPAAFVNVDWSRYIPHL
ncbi:hypothetical protein C8F01DRAFT_985806 [Mycena amicta]|nr:hypothetical protein C8F01DRAFT_985806 [Mycena amicta]